MENSSDKEQIGLLSAIAIGIGGMVGGGIFAVLGLAVQLSKGGTMISFALAGLIALITAYSYSKLSITFPNRGGTVEYLNQGFGTGIFSGSLNVLLWISYIVMLSLYAYAFGSYGSSFFPESTQLFWKHGFITLSIVLFTLLNIFGSSLVGKSEEYIVAVKLLILLTFIGLGLSTVDTTALAPSTWSSPLQLVAGGMIIFLAYEGFELIANTSETIKNPTKNLPRSFYGSVAFVILLYILIAIVAVGNLPVSKIIEAKDYALAAAAEPFMGQAGYTIIAIAALLSTGSAINATLYGATKVSYIIAKDGELPAQLEKNIWNRPIEGLLISAVLTIIIANGFNISSISTMGSTGFLIIFAAVNWANFRLAHKTNSRKFLPVVGIIVCIGSLITLIVYTWRQNPQTLWVLVVMLALSFAIEFTYRKVTGREIKPAFEIAEKE
jgi:hypothetical protein